MDMDLRQLEDILLMIALMCRAVTRHREYSRGDKQQAQHKAPYNPFVDVA
jgi:hypothetical protein